MSQTIDLFIPNRRRSELGKYLTTVKGLRAEARKPVPLVPRVREHAQDVPAIRTPNQYKGAFLERYEEPCGCQACTAKRTIDAGEFKEEEHPRDKGGEFTNKGQGTTAKPERLERKNEWSRPPSYVHVNPTRQQLPRLLDSLPEKYGRIVAAGNDFALADGHAFIHSDIANTLRREAHPMYEALPKPQAKWDYEGSPHNLIMKATGEFYPDYGDKRYKLADGTFVTINKGNGKPSSPSEWPLALRQVVDDHTPTKDDSPYYGKVYTTLPPGVQRFEEIFEQALAFPRGYEIAPHQLLQTLDDFKEEEHPRGQTENAGQFAEKAGGSKVKRSAALVPAKADRSDLPEHIKKLVLPPAWTNVHYNPDPGADLLAQGKDVKGRLQSVYSEAFAKKNSQAKFGRVSELEKTFMALTDKNEKNRKSKLPIVRDTADVAKLIMETGIRPGSNKETGAKVKAYGATTLLGQHVIADASGVSLKFVGKKGVNLSIPVTDKATASMLRHRAGIAGPNGKLFPATSAEKLQGYVKQLSANKVHPKDFRTYVATSTALGAIRMMPKPETFVSYKKSVHEVAKRVAAKLGNTPLVALTSYINPVVFSEWRSGLPQMEQGQHT